MLENPTPLVKHRIAGRPHSVKFSSRKVACHVRLCSAQLFCVSGIAAAAARTDYRVGCAKYGHQKVECFRVRRRSRRITNRLDFCALCSQGGRSRLRMRFADRK